MQSNNPFARFERSRGGLVIPIILFVAGVLATCGAVETVQRADRRARQQQNQNVLEQLQPSDLSRDAAEPNPSEAAPAESFPSSPVQGIEV